MKKKIQFIIEKESKFFSVLLILGVLIVLSIDLSSTILSYFINFALMTFLQTSPRLYFIYCLGWIFIILGLVSFILRLINHKD